jgi:hypothetical protein
VLINTTCPRMANKTDPWSTCRLTEWLLSFRQRLQKALHRLGHGRRRRCSGSAPGARSSEFSRKPPPYFTALCFTSCP